MNRRITSDTPMRIAGPAAGTPRMRTAADPSGTTVRGMINNCSGGVTPWGTILTCEENINFFFLGSISGPETSNHKRYGFSGKPEYGWGRFHDRFNLDKEPNAANLFGWVVEIDPYDPSFTPIKRTALGRFKHEAANTTLDPHGHVVVYSGDDERFEYLYKFVSKGVYDERDRAANLRLLDEGTLYVAKFGDDGAVTWLPLVYGEGPLKEANGFTSQADVVIEVRSAADLVGATPMDRPEDVDVSPVSGKVYVVLTNNTARKADKLDKANPRANNQYGQILEITPATVGGLPDHGATTANWDMFLLAGNPNRPEDGAKYGGALSASGWLACPDNITFDAKGRLWIASDQGTDQHKFGIGDGVWACDTEGPGRAVTRMFYRTPQGAEMCGPAFTPDCKTFFVAVQHPASDDPGSTYDKPSTRWPDFKPDMPPRPSVVVITKNDGGVIGG
jgi:secreted PhoX family phosphatase